MVGVNERQVKERQRGRAIQPLPLVDGIVWRDEWKAPYEGALTLLWKIALANCLTPRELSSRLFGTHLLSGSPSGMHGRTLLTPRWMSGSSTGATQLGRVVQDAGLDIVSARWVDAIASDEHVRYCKGCLAEGYQSAYCQIDGMLKCPVHGLPLLDVCTSCGVATPRYALTSLTMSSPFRCAACGEPLAERSWSPTGYGATAPPAPKSQAYRILELWLASIETLEISWPQLLSWQCCSEGQLGNVERRIAVFEVLGRLAPLSLKRACRRKLATDLTMSDHPAEMPGTFIQFRHIEPTEKWDARRHTYRAIRRHLARVLARHHRRCLMAGSDALHIEWDSEVLHPIAPVCPLVLGYCLWRHHFEGNVAVHPRIGSSSRILHMREEVLSWPADWEVGLKAWAMFAVMSFAAYVQVAREWCVRTERVADGQGKMDFAATMQLIADFRVALSPRYMAWPSRITFFHQRSPHLEGGGERLTIVGPAGRLHEMLAQGHIALGHPAASPTSRLGY